MTMASTIGDQATEPIEVMVNTNAGSIQGTVMGPDQKPVPSTLVVLVPPENRRQNPVLYKTARSDPQGRFYGEHGASGQLHLVRLGKRSPPAHGRTRNFSARTPTAVLPLLSLQRNAQTSTSDSSKSAANRREGTLLNANSLVGAVHRPRLQESDRLFALSNSPSRPVEDWTITESSAKDLSRGIRGTVPEFRHTADPQAGIPGTVPRTQSGVYARVRCIRVQTVGSPGNKHSDFR
jgi:hypothetical protein